MNEHYRSRKFLDLAHRVHVCQNCGKWVGTEGMDDGCEPAHANWQEYGKGGAMKAHDNFHAAICHDCHVELDQGSGWTREEKKHVWLMAHLKTMLLYFLKGWLVVK